MCLIINNSHVSGLADLDGRYELLIPLTRGNVFVVRGVCPKELRKTVPAAEGVGRKPT